jgi:limonene-1,2-epoxide hydrolase
VVFLERLDRHRLDHGWRKLPVNSVFEVDGDKITVWRDYFDLGTAAKIHDAGAA